MSDHNSDIVTPTPADETQSYAQYEAANPVTNDDSATTKRIKVHRMLKAGFKPTEIVEALGVSTGYIYKVRANPPEGEPPKVEKPTRSTPEMALENLSQYKRDFLLALFDSKGILTYAVKSCQMSFQTYYTWLNNDPEFAERVHEIKESAIDFVERSLFNQIAEGVPSSTQFYLKTKAKHRGYTERTEHTGLNGGAMQVRVIEPYVDPLSDVEEKDDSIEAEYTILEPK